MTKHTLLEIMITFVRGSLNVASISWVTKSISFEEGSLSFSICSFATCSNALSGVKRPDLIPKGGGGNETRMQMRANSSLKHAYSLLKCKATERDEQKLLSTA